MHRPIDKSAAFTLIELLVVISIMVLLIALLMPALANARESARGALCLANQHQIGIGIALYSEDSNQWLPVGVYCYCAPVHPWHDSALWAAVVAEWTGQTYVTEYPANATFFPDAAVFPGYTNAAKPHQGMFKCPDDARLDCWGSTVSISYDYNSSYYGMGCNDTYTYDYPIWFPGQGYENAYGRIRISSVPDPATTVVLADSNWPSGDACEYDNTELLGYGADLAIWHNGGANVLWADGHASFQRPASLTAQNFNRLR